ncbi:MAG: hypothetical protein ABIK89_13325, partial [Planctomycetota bacterium]
MAGTGDLPRHHDGGSHDARFHAVILSGVRTPIGSLGGALASAPAPELGVVSIREALARAGIAPEEVDEVILGNVLGAGVGQNPARQASLGAALP